jgi:hypothetical protein
VKPALTDAGPPTPPGAKNALGRPLETPGEKT